MPETAEREKPILMSAPMVRAILDGRKTVTRRVVKPQPECRYPGNATRGAVVHVGSDGPIATVGFGAACEQWRFGPCPYGEPGTRLWVRESFAVIEKRPEERGSYGEIYGPLGDHGDWEAEDRLVFYRADGPPLYHAEGGETHGIARWRPSIHMPRWASRITLEVVDVRVERLQEITMADAHAEGGCKTRADHSPWMGCSQDFAYLWDSINAKRGFGWDANPWIWRVEFRRVQP